MSDPAPVSPTPVDAALAPGERDPHLRLMLEQLPAIVWTTDANLRVTSCTGAALAALGLRAGEVAGTLLTEYFRTTDPNYPPLAAMTEALQGKSAAFENDWQGRTYQGHVEPLRDRGRVTGTIGLAVDVTERKRLEGALAYQAFHDGLTDLANRALFRDRVQHALARAGRGEHVAVLFLDLDDFKGVNDSLGHAEGDALLRRVADRLRASTRGFDTVARLGGDEFAVLLEGMVSPAEVGPVVERVTEALAVPIVLAGREVIVRASIGVAHADIGSESADELLRNADVAMYRAKALGKGRHVLFEPAMHAAAIERLEVEAELRHAIATPAMSGLRLAYQPVMDLGTSRLAGFEALVRWSHPVRGDIPPAAFIPVAEETGLVIAIGRWALGEACRQLAEWELLLPRWTPTHRAPTVAVNLSGRQLEDDGLVGELAAVLATTGVTPQRVTLEITESAIMRNTEATLARLHALKRLGVRLAIDDFGTGYSSLAYLQRFPVDVLKIDKAFVDGVGRTAGVAANTGYDAALVRTIIALSDTLGLATVAEGIEREEQRALLAALGCRYGQGYLFARPLTAERAGMLAAELATDIPKLASHRDAGHAVLIAK